MRPSGSLVSKSCIFKYMCKLMLVSKHVRTRRSYDPTLLKKNKTIPLSLVAVKNGQKNLP